MLDVRKDFPLLRNNSELCYLDSAATSQKPDWVIETVVDFMSHSNANVRRGSHGLVDAAEDAYASAKQKVAGFIGATPEEIVFTANATASINTVARGLRTETRRNGTCVTNAEHNSNYLPWLRRGPVYLFDHQLDYYWNNWEADRTRIIAMTHVSNVLGEITPVKQVAKLAGDMDAYLLVDAAQSIGHMSIDVDHLGCDFLAFSGHKMLGLTGIGCLYINRCTWDEMRPVFLGGGTVDKIDQEGYNWIGPPEGYEAGTPPVIEAVSLKAAIEYLENLGMGNVYEHINYLTRYCTDKLLNIGIMPVGGPHKHGLVSFNLDDIHPHDVVFELDKLQIAVRGGHQCAHVCYKALNLQSSVRASFHVYNTTADIDRLIEGLQHVRQTYAK